MVEYTEVLEVTPVPTYRLELDMIQQTLLIEEDRPRTLSVANLSDLINLVDLSQGRLSTHSQGQDLEDLGLTLVVSDDGLCIVEHT